MTLLLSALLLLCCVALVWQGILIRAQRRDIGDLTRRIEWMLDDEPHTERVPPEVVEADCQEVSLTQGTNGAWTGRAERDLHATHRPLSDPNP